MTKKKIGFLGCNNMNGAILKGALKAGVLEKEDVLVYDIAPAVLEHMKGLGIKTVSNNKELCEQSDIIILGVKPQHVPIALEECGAAIEGKALMSIVAGLTIARLEKLLKAPARILRIMPNTPSLVGAGVNVFCQESQVTEEEKAVAVEIFSAIGMVEWVPEKLINVVSGLSGGGPAYIAIFIEAMADAGVQNGLSRDLSYRLAAGTCLGTGKLLLEREMHPGALKDMVTSPGGTTIEGVKALEKGGFRHAVMDCVTKATKKAGKL